MLTKIYKPEEMVEIDGYWYGKDNNIMHRLYADGTPVLSEDHKEWWLTGYDCVCEAWYEHECICGAFTRNRARY